MLASAGNQLFYFTFPKDNKHNYEVDFLLSRGNKIIPIEVKAEENLKAKSLKVYYNKFKPKIAIRTSMSNYREQEWMVNVPLYLLDNFLDKKCNENTLEL